MCRPLVLGCQKGLSGLFCWGSRVAEVAQRAAFALRGAGRADGTAVQHHPVAEIVRFLRRQTPAQLLLNLHGVLAAVRNAEPPRDADTVRVADIALLPVDVTEDEVGGFSSDTRQAEKIVHVVRHATAKAREQLLRAPAMLLPQQGYALEEVRLSVERLEGYILQCQAQQNDTPAARCGRLAVAYINEHYADCDLKLPDVLEHLGVSRSYFSTVFKEKTGQSFVEYLTNLRMEKAKEYLRETGLCTYEIAERIGFADPHYFSLTFRRRTGMTPRQYREAESGT